MRTFASIRSFLASRSGIVLAVVLAAVLGTASLAFAEPGLLGPAEGEQAADGDRPPEVPDPLTGTDTPAPTDEGEGGEEGDTQDGPSRRSRRLPRATPVQSSRR